MEGCFVFQWWGVCFSDGGFSFLSGGHPIGGIGFGGEEGGGAPSHYGKPCIIITLSL